MSKEKQPHKVYVSGCPFGGCVTCDEQDERIKKLEEGIVLYMELIKQQQFTLPETIKKISKITGQKYENGHLISSIIRDLEQALKGGD